MAYATALDCKAISAIPAVQAKIDADLDTKYIPRAERIVNAWTRQNFNKATKTIRMTGSGSRIQVLPERLAVLTTVKFLELDSGGKTIVSEEEVDDVFNRFWYMIGEANFSTPRKRSKFGSFPDMEDNIEVTGDFGYSTVPDEVRDATCLIVEKIIVDEASAVKKSGAFKSEKIGDYSYTLADTPKSEGESVSRMIPPEAKLYLRAFQKPPLPRVP